MDGLTTSRIGSQLAYSLLALVLYAGLCNAIRFRRIRRLERKYGFGTRERPYLSSMTNKEAYEIQHFVSDSEFPAIFEKGLQLALFRTYGIPTIAKLLNATYQLNSIDNVAKRYADTEVIITEIYSNTPDDPRSHEAFARLNYLHGHYIKAGKISNDDMLYTLGLFMNHPVEWINRYEWRQLTHMEVCAIATFHKSMGEAMHISYEVLPSHKTGWRDGLHFFDELDTWCKEYEASVMVPNRDSNETALMTKRLFLTTVPRFSHGLVAQVISAAMDDTLREAIMFPRANSIAKSFLDNFMAFRRFFLRYFALPRLTSLKNLSEDETPEGRRHVQVWGIQPFYVKSTFWSRWGPSGLFQLLIGAPRPGDEGMYEEGYLRSNVGPKRFEGRGRDDFEKEKKVVSGIRTNGCPFVGVK